MSGSSVISAADLTKWYSCKNRRLGARIYFLRDVLICVTCPQPVASSGNTAHPSWGELSASWERYPSCTTCSVWNSPDKLSFAPVALFCKLALPLL